MGNTAMNRAQATKDDEFYTLLTEVEQELTHYRKHFKGKKVFLNCDDPDISAFWQYFSNNFEFFGLKKLTSTHYEKDKNVNSYKLVMEQDDTDNSPIITKTNLSGDGDFRSEECVEILKEADIVVTNPPFSLFREYMAQLIEYEKKFVIIGNQNAFVYKEIFPLLENDIIWTGYKNGSMTFRIPDYYPDKSSTYIGKDGNKYQKLGNICWFTNLEIDKRNEELVLTKFYEGNEGDYPRYDNYDAIEVGRVRDIPMDFEGAMGVPITFINSHNPKQFEILGVTDRNDTSGLRTKIYTREDGKNYSDLNRRSVTKNSDGKYKLYYARILIKNKKPISKKEMLGF